MRHVDVVVVGAGIAGASAAHALAGRAGSVLLVEQEPQPGSHATGRSASVLSETSGPTAVCALARASRSFFEAPPPGFAEHPLLSPRGLLWVGRRGDEAALDELADRGAQLVPTVRRLDPGACRAVVPFRPEAVAGGGVLEPDAMAIDVAALLAGFLRAARALGVEVVTGARLERGTWCGDRWELLIGDRRVAASTVVDAAGAWADDVAGRCEVPALGIRPLRRTAAIAAVPDDAAVRTWPLVMDVAGRYYFEPEPGGLLVSPADEHPTEPCDPQPDELDVALGLERVAEATGLELRSVRRCWAGLRTFAIDRVPVVGRDRTVPGFVWLAGQGGAGIKTAPAMARCAASLVVGDGLPADVVALGVSEADLSPARFGPVEAPRSR